MIEWDGRDYGYMFLRDYGAYLPREAGDEGIVGDHVFYLTHLLLNNDLMDHIMKDCGNSDLSIN